MPGLSIQNPDEGQWGMQKRQTETHREEEVGPGGSAKPR